ncbi:putative repeat protein (TIGR01451 family) [Paenibacillus shirakamiensis]|uniref:Repeat protein (TIGR01451 family) n=1 Tax=Paenibacillus shirakamiensis TaxID=1265935 RepID=A0ABS4JF53_9BACL|nr:DUF11 domain-containing protein [Paenibacillus shirakamiensis]MBP2000346.1 putative repeat protein (TIGR01451 family) [Paenibacillus shirakamiensis]
MPFIERYVINANGAMTYTGNTLGLSRSETQGRPGTVDSIGAFITTNTSSQLGTYPPGTTNQYTLNSSAAVLAFPPGSTVLYAELIWGGTYIDNGVDLTAFINNPVSLTTPAGSLLVTPDSATSFEVLLSPASAQFPNTYAYVRSADVTAAITAGGAGTYITGGVVGTIVIPDPTSNHAGWTLGVVYANASLPLRNMSLRVTADVIQATSGPVTMAISGFATPFQGPLSGRALFSAQEGDANKTGDQALFGPTLATIVPLSGPNNFATNFFASQINGDNGVLNTSGTFGTRNQINGTPGTNISGGRQGWDITNVDISSTLINTQTQGFLRLTTNGDGYLIDSVGLQININTPVLNAVKSGSQNDAIVGDTITYTVQVSNSSMSDATNAILFDNIPEGSTFVANSATVNGVPQPGTDPVGGIPIGTILAGGSATVTFQVNVTSVPSPPRLFDQAKVGYTAPTVPGGPIINEVAPTNSVTIPIYQPNVSIVKSANTTNALIGDTITYTLFITNTGNINTSTIVTDNIPSGSSFVPGSVTVDGVVQPTLDPISGISFVSVAQGSSVTITFQTLVTAQPPGFYLVDQGTANYTFQPPDGRVIPGSVVSNPVSVLVSIPELSITKTANQADAVVGDIITYSFVIANQDGAFLTNLNFSEATPAGSQFVAGSVMVNGIPVPGANPDTGFALGAIGSGASFTVTFNVLVVSLPNPPTLTDVGQVTFSRGAFQGASFSNPITIPVYQPIITTFKETLTPVAIVGQTVTYQITITNSGNIGATSTFTDPIDPTTTFVPGSVQVNGVSQPAFNPNSGIPLGLVPAGGNVDVTFQVTIDSQPPTGTVTNQGVTDYTFTPPDGRVINGSNGSNIVTVPISSNNLTLLKIASQVDAVPGDVITYTVNVSNTQGLAATNVVLMDNIPTGSTFVEGSVLVDGIASAGDPTVGIPLGTIAPGQTIAVSFSVLVLAAPTPVPTPLLLTDQASVTFTSGTFTGTSLSNFVNLPVIQPVLFVNKSANPTVVRIGDVVTYTVVVSNLGNYNADVIVTDVLPPGNTFVPNSVLIDGSYWQGADPNTGINIGTVIPLTRRGPGEDGVSGFNVSFTFQTIIIALPDPPFYNNQAIANYNYFPPDGRSLSGTSASNVVTVQVVTDNITILTKTADQTAVTTGTIITYTLQATNNTSVDVLNYVLTDNIPNGTTFVTGSVTVGGSPVADAVPTAGIHIGVLPGGGTIVVTFQVRVSDAGTGPVLDITNQASATFTAEGTLVTTTSNPVPITNQQAILTILKSTTLSSALPGDLIPYTLVVSNTGNVEATVTLIDPISPGTSFRADSVSINGVNQPGVNPENGVSLGTLAPGGTTTVTFIVFVSAVPGVSSIINTASAGFSYVLQDGTVVPGTAESNSVTTPIGSPDIALVKLSNVSSVQVGGVVTFTLTLTNRSVDAITNAVVTDIIPVNTTLVTGSVTVNQIAQPNADPASGVSVGILNGGQSALITFQITANTGSAGTTIANVATAAYQQNGIPLQSSSNQVQIVVGSVVPPNGPNLTFTKTTNASQVFVGSTITFTVIGTNSGDVAGAAVVSDPLPDGIQFIPGSVVVDGVAVTGVSPLSGIPVAMINPGSSVQVSFQALVLRVPPAGYMINQINAVYQPVGAPSNPQTAVLSNKIVIPVQQPPILVAKSSSTNQVEVGSVLRYNLTISNPGTAPANNVVVTDILQDESRFLSGSLSINGQLSVTSSLVDGITIGDVQPGAQAQVDFAVTIIRQPIGGKLFNQASVSYQYGASSTIRQVSNRSVVQVFEQEE